MKALSFSILLPLVFSAQLGMAKDASKEAAKIKTGLPLDSAVLIEKLDRYNDVIRKEAEEKIAEKRQEVAVVLERHLKERAKAGDLDGALAIRTVLEEWKEQAAQAIATSDEKTGQSGWKPLFGKGKDTLVNWLYAKGEHIEASEGTLTLDTRGSGFKHLAHPALQGNVVLRMTVEVDYDSSVEKEQQAGIQLQLVSKDDATKSGSVACLLQGPEANVLWGGPAGGKDTLMAIVENDAGIGEAAEMQFAFVDGHVLVFSGRRRIHKFHETQFDQSGVSNIALIGNNSRAVFKNVELLVPDAAQVKTLLLGKPIVER